MRSAGMNVVEVEGATGFADTNYRGKVAAALDELERADAVFVHAGAAEEISLKGNLDDKVLAIGESYDSANDYGAVLQMKFRTVGIRRKPE